MQKKSLRKVERVMIRLPLNSATGLLNSATAALDAFTFAPSSPSNSTQNDDGRLAFFSTVAYIRTWRLYCVGYVVHDMVAPFVTSISSLSSEMRFLIDPFSRWLKWSLAE